MKLLFVDWDGPFENPATYAYRTPSGQPGADPRVVYMANCLLAHGWRIVLTSTIRKNSECRDVSRTVKFMRAHGLQVQPDSFFLQSPDSWRTDLGFHGTRYDEVANWFRQNELRPDAEMIVFDDELVSMRELSAIVQPAFDTMNGLYYTGTSLFLDFCKQHGVKV